MRTTICFCIILLVMDNVACAQTARVGGRCEGCDMMFIGMPEKMHASDTSPGWSLNQPKLLVKGKVYKADGRTPAGGIILYYYHTDDKGNYSWKSGMDERARRHGYIRGWVKTDSHGNYSIYTIRPAPYPSGNAPAHIHVLVKEPDLPNEYYVDEFVFDDDPNTAAEKPNFQNRGGSGILHTVKSNNMLVADHNVILGLNIPDYPNKK